MFTMNDMLYQVLLLDLTICLYLAGLVCAICCSQLSQSYEHTIQHC